MNKQTIRVGAYVVGTCALAFAFYKGYKYVKAVKEREAEQKAIDEATELAAKEKKDADELKEAATMAAEWAEKRSKVLREALDEQLQEEIEAEEEEMAAEWNYSEYEDECTPEMPEGDIKTWTKEELKVRMFDRDSDEALEQFKYMMISDVENEQLREKLLFLYSLPYVPSGTKDETMASNIDDRYAEFFSEGSIHYGNRTWADVVMHWAFMLNFDLYWDVEKAVELILHCPVFDNNPLYIADGLAELTEHCCWYTNDEGDSYFGLFGLISDEGPDGKVNGFIDEYWGFVSGEMDIAEADETMEDDYEYDPEEAYAETEEDEEDE